jgi:hypothetical protein
MLSENTYTSWYDLQPINRKSIMRVWTDNLTIRQQAVLLTAIRGCDAASKSDPSKSILWALRWEILYPSERTVDPTRTKSFMGITSSLHEDIRVFQASLDQYPFHFVMHLMHAIEIVGYKHHHHQVRAFWNELYLDLVRENLHCNPETEEQMDERLADR